VPCIWVLAGTNGAGKSSIAGELLRRAGGEPREFLHLLGGRIAAIADPKETPEWAKPIVAAALRLSAR
jgi:predicted ABC-type ATPase